jgi:hypothetical protein
MARGIGFKGKGAGKIMIDWVLSKANELAEEVGCRYVVLDSESHMVDRYLK